MAKLSIYEASTEFLKIAGFIDEPKYCYRDVIHEFLHWHTKTGSKNMAVSTFDFYVKGLVSRGVTYSNRSAIVLCIYYYWLSFKGYTEDKDDVMIIKNDDLGLEPKRRLLTTGQINRLGDYLDKNVLKFPFLRDRLLVYLLGSTGISLLQIAKLKVKDVDLAKGRIFIGSKDPKVKTQSILMDAGTMQAAEMWMSFRQNPEEPLLISLKNGNAFMSVSDLAGLVKARMNEVGLIADCYTHDSLRVASIWYLLNHDHSLFQIEKFMRYKYSTLADVYFLDDPQ